MKILGIDPGMAIVGYSVLEVNGDSFELITSGSIQTQKGETDAYRLHEIFQDISTIIDTYKPDIASIEKLFYFRNQTTIIPVAEARGVIIMALEKFKVPVFEYTPMEVKQVLTGFGRADKKEVEKMVKITLQCDELPKLDDTIDSIAIAICHTRKNNILQTV
ncbi:MAG: crossover junction endodeoxyribonuclease RuvC [Candidatus Gastranaerophilaceae bacterium]